MTAVSPSAPRGGASAAITSPKAWALPWPPPSWRAAGSPPGKPAASSAWPRPGRPACEARHL